MKMTLSATDRGVSSLEQYRPVENSHINTGDYHLFGTRIVQKLARPSAFSHDAVAQQKIFRSL